MSIVKGLLAAAIAYLLGSINAAILVSKYSFGFDIREHGSGNAGLTNVFRVLGKKAALVVLLIDVAKGVISALLGGWILGKNGQLFAGIFTLVGHIFPLYFGFKGGKGVLTTAAIMMVYDPVICLICLGVFVLVCVLTRYISLASILAAITLPVGQIFFCRSGFSVAVGLMIMTGILYFHRGNIHRLRAGTEPKFSWNRKKIDDKQKRH